MAVYPRVRPESHEHAILNHQRHQSGGVGCFSKGLLFQTILQLVQGFLEVLLLRVQLLEVNIPQVRDLENQLIDASDVKNLAPGTGSDKCTHIISYRSGHCMSQVKQIAPAVNPNILGPVEDWFFTGLIKA